MKGWFEPGLEPKSGEWKASKVHDLDSAEEVWALLREHGGPGWVCTADFVRRTPCEDLSGTPPLSAEIALSATRSLHLRQWGTGWRAWILEDRVGEGPDLYLDETFLSTEGSARLRYRIWWRLQKEDDVEVWRPFASRFLAWEDR